MESLSGVDPTTDVWKGCQEIFRHPLSTIRSSLIGLFVGAVPGAGKAVAAFFSYLIAIRASKHPETFGRGDVEGVIASEAANNASGGGGGALIPTLTLGIPGSSGMALILAGMMYLGIRSGPSFIIFNAPMMYAMFAGLIMGMIMALILNIIVIKPMAKAVRIPTEILVPLFLILAFLGSYALRHSLFGMSVTLVFGILGYYMDRYGYSTVCMVLAMILGSIASESFFQAWKIGDRSFTIFFYPPSFHRFDCVPRFVHGRTLCLSAVEEIRCFTPMRIFEIYLQAHAMTQNTKLLRDEQNYARKEKHG
ncbi:MAG: tripartite tricarboxylate transporter permease [Thermodesulfobacteriota bacterium]